jgi:hypothetical protein
MNEATLKAELVKIARAAMNGYVIIRHEDRGTYGIPDISATGNGKTSWWEAKFANPDFNSKGIQDLTMLRLANVGLARYIIYEITKEKDKFVHIVHPRDLAKWRESGEMSVGFDHLWVISKIKEVNSNDYVRP